MASTKSLDELVQELSPDCQMEVRDFVEFLLTRRSTPQGNKLQQNWAGALREHRGQYSSVDLQHQVSKWRPE